MKYDFDEIINRIGTNSVIYETSLNEEPNLPENYIPMWIADMDFACPPEIIDAMRKRLDDRILGYSDIIDPSYFDAVKNWMKERFDWNIKKQDLYISAGVVPAISNLIQILSKEGENILITTPSYKPFYNTIVCNGRTPVFSPLKIEDDQYVLDFDDIEKIFRNENIKILIFCNPHNPSGRVWKKWELKKIADLCKAYGIPIISDEIHQDIRRKGTTHIPLAKLYPDADWIYTCTAPSKTFNMAGNHMANIFIPNQHVREIWEEKFYYLPNPLSIAATKAAYEKCGTWVDQLNDYLDENFQLMKNYFDENLPWIKFVIPEGTYLAWFNMKNSGYSLEKIKDKFIKEAGLHIETGDMFVGNGEYSIRMNLACPRQTLINALTRMHTVFCET